MKQFTKKKEKSKESNMEIEKNVLNEKRKKLQE